MGKGELQIIIGSEKANEDTPIDVPPIDPDPDPADVDGSHTVLIKADPKNGKLKPPKKKSGTKRNAALPFAFLSPLYTNKMCFRATISVLMTIALVCVIFLAVGLMQYAKEHDLQEAFLGGRPKWPFSKYQVHKHTEKPSEDDNKDKTKENSKDTLKGQHNNDKSKAMSRNALKEKHPPFVQEKNLAVKFVIDQSKDHCDHYRHDETCGNYSVYHATKQLWSAIANHKTRACYLFKLRNEVDACPKDYPWIADKHMGILPRLLPATADKSLHEFTAVYQRVSRCVLRTPMADLSMTGPMISNACAHYTSHRVLGVAVMYRKMQRQARSASKTLLDTLKDNEEKLVKDEWEEGYKWSPNAKLPAEDNKDAKWLTTVMDDDGVEVGTTTGTIHPIKAVVE